MLDLDETDLIEFFSVLPEPQPLDERESFDAPLFVKSIDGVTVTFSISFLRHDLYCDLSLENKSDDLLRSSVSNVVVVRIEKDSDGRSWLRALSENGSKFALSVEPRITIQIQDV
jgi:hypothetical protein